MSEGYSASAKVYLTEDGIKFSILDMLSYFEKRGAMRSIGLFHRHYHCYLRW